MNNMASMEEFVSPELLEEMFGISSIMSLLSGIPGMLISLATYFAIAYALYTIANRRGISNPWLAWIPVINVWTLGAIADDYRLRVNGELKSRRKILLGTNIAMYILLLLVLVLCVVMIVSLITSGVLEFEYISDESMGEIILPAVGMVLLCLPMMVVAIVHAIFSYIALYEVYKSCDPGNAVLYLVLSIFINICQPVFLFLCRNKDEGMPKLQPEIPPVSWEPPAPVEEPWNNPTQL